MKDGGALIFGACNGCDYDNNTGITKDDSDRLMLAVQKLTGNRITIVMSRDYVVDKVAYIQKNTKTGVNIPKGSILDLGRSRKDDNNKGWRVLKPNESKPTNTGKDMKLNSRGDSYSDVDKEKTKK